MHDSDHDLRISKIQFDKGMVFPSKKKKSITNALRLTKVARQLNIELNNRFTPLLELDDLPTDTILVDVWNDFKKVVHSTAKDVKSDKTAKKPWVSDETLQLIIDRSEVRAKINQCESISKADADYLADIRKKVRKAVKKDKQTFYQHLAESAEKASNLGNQREVHRVVKQIAGKSVAGATDLTGLPIDNWIAYFKSLLGDDSEKKIPDSIKDKCAWRKANDWINDDSKYAEEWNIAVGPPTLEEVRKAVMTSKSNKGVNRDQIPMELWKNSDRAMNLLCKMIRHLWKQILQDESHNVDIPKDWTDATLVCLFKNKGSRKDPSKYRGISLISTIEKIMATLILNRIRKNVNERLMQGQNGFRPLKSCRDAVFRLWREIERDRTSKKPFLLTFIDYSKAFDSLGWINLWKTLKFAGCPKEIIKVIKTLYEKSTISIRVSSDGTLAKEFKQKQGIRQGSTLSPCLFVIAMDFCLRVFQDACKEKGLPAHDGTWIAYADDIADKSMSEEEASAALQELEAASAFVGLRLNVKKTQVLAHGVKKVERRDVRLATKERVAVTFNKHTVLQGWKTHCKWAHLLGFDKQSDFKSDMVAIVFDKDVDGSQRRIIAEDRGGGWLKHEKKSYRIRKLGNETNLKDDMHMQIIKSIVSESSSHTSPWKEQVQVTFKNKERKVGWKTMTQWAALMDIKVPSKQKLDGDTVIVFEDKKHWIVGTQSKNGWFNCAKGNKLRTKSVKGTRCNIEIPMHKGKVCLRCGSSFDSERGLKTHIGRGRCRKFTEMSVSEQVRLRRTRQVSAKRRAKVVAEAELVNVRTCEGQQAIPCGSFVYLGSMIEGSTSATPEIQRRINKALVTFGSMYRIWKSNSLTHKTKAALYKALILSIMLYNAEVWPIQQKDMKSLEGAHFRMMRKMLALDDEKVHRVSQKTLFKTFGLSAIANYITEKRMRWIGHALRRDEKDASKQAMKQALEDEESPWTKLVQEDLKKMKWKKRSRSKTWLEELEELAAARPKFRKMTWHKAYDHFG